MDIDVHYYGTYVLARGARIRREVASMVAMAAGCIGDPYDGGSIQNVPGARFVQEVSNRPIHANREAFATTIPCDCYSSAKAAGIALHS